MIDRRIQYDHEVARNVSELHALLKQHRSEANVQIAQGIRTHQEMAPRSWYWIDVAIADVRPAFGDKQLRDSLGAIQRELSAKGANEYRVTAGGALSRAGFKGVQITPECAEVMSDFHRALDSRCREGGIWYASPVSISEITREADSGRSAYEIDVDARYSGGRADPGVRAFAERLSEVLSDPSLPEVFRNGPNLGRIDDLAMEQNSTIELFAAQFQEVLDAQLWSGSYSVTVNDRPAHELSRSMLAHEYELDEEVEIER